MIMRAATAQIAMTRRVLFVSALIVAVAVSTAQLKPISGPAPKAPDLEALLPGAFGDWRRIELGATVLPPEAELGPGEAIAYRAYGDNAGRVVTLVAAYGPPLGDSVRLHRPESCYVAQGFSIKARSIEHFSLAGTEASIIRLQTEGPSRAEAVSYWLRLGSDFVTGGPSSQLIDFRRGLGGGLDGALIRVSSTGKDESLFRLHQTFLEEFAASLQPQARALFLTGDAPTASS